MKPKRAKRYTKLRFIADNVNVLPVFPRTSVERDALTRQGKVCGAICHSGIGWACTRAPNHRGDHIATTPTEVCARWENTGRKSASCAIHPRKSNPKGAK